MTQGGTGSRSDEQLLWECLRERQTAPWGQVIHVFHRVIALSVIRALKQPSASDSDLVDERIQEVYLRLCTDDFRILRESRADLPSALFALVKVVATTTIIDYWRTVSTKRRGREMDIVSIEDTVAADCADSGLEEEFERLRLIEQIDGVMKELCRKAGQPLNDCRDRHIFWLHFQQGCTAKEIAAIPGLKLNPKGVETALHRVVTELRRFFGENREGHSS